MRYYIFFFSGLLFFFGIVFWIIGITKLLTASKKINQNLAIRDGQITILQGIIDLTFGFLYYKFSDEFAENWLFLILITSIFMPIFFIADFARKKNAAKFFKEIPKA